MEKKGQNEKKTASLSQKF